MNQIGLELLEHTSALHLRQIQREANILVELELESLCVVDGVAKCFRWEDLLGLGIVRRHNLGLLFKCKNARKKSEMRNEEIAKRHQHHTISIVFSCF